MKTLNFILTDKNEANATKKVCTLVNGQVVVSTSTVPVANISALRDFLIQKQLSLGSSSFMLADSGIVDCTVIFIPTGQPVSDSDMALPSFYNSSFKGPDAQSVLFDLVCENIIKTKILQ